MTILLAAADDNLIAAANKAFAATGSTFVVARSGLECLESVRSMVPDLVIIDDYLPWGGADGVLEVLEECDEAWIAEMPILLLTDGGQSISHRSLRTYPIARPDYCRKLSEMIDSFECDGVA